MERARRPARPPPPHPHPHMTSASEEEKQRYLAFKAQTFHESGEVVVCRMCDPIINNQCILTKRERFFQKTLSSKPLSKSPVSGQKLQLSSSILQDNDRRFLRPIPISVLRKLTKNVNKSVIPNTQNLIREKAELPRVLGNSKKARRRQRIAEIRYKRPSTIKSQNLVPVKLQIIENSDIEDLTDNMEVFDKPAIPPSRNIIKVNVTNKTITTNEGEGNIEEIKDASKPKEEIVAKKQTSSINETFTSTNERASTKKGSVSEKAAYADIDFQKAVDSLRLRLKSPKEQLAGNAILSQPGSSKDLEKQSNYFEYQQSNSRISPTEHQSNKNDITYKINLSNKKRLELRRAGNMANINNSITVINRRNTAVISSAASLRLQNNNFSRSSKAEPTLPISLNQKFIEYTNQFTEKTHGSVLRQFISIPTCHENIDSSQVISSSQENLTSRQTVAYTCYGSHRKGVPRVFNNAIPGEIQVPRTLVACEEVKLSDSDEEQTPPIIPDLLLSVGQPSQPHSVQSLDQATPLTKSKEDEKQPGFVSHIPITQRLDLIRSDDSTVRAMVKRWPWSKPVRECYRVSYDEKEDLVKEYEYMVTSCYEDSTAWIQIIVTGYPQFWNRQQVLDALINWKMVGDMPLVPCFIEFSPKECKFLVNKNSEALEYLHFSGLTCHMEDYRLNLTISQLDLRINNLKFGLQNFLEHRFRKCYDKETNVVDLTAFLLKADISQMCYFPLNKAYNQKHIVGMSSQVAWENITKLILAGNRLTFINNFHLPDHMISLKELDLSDNRLSSACKLTCCRGMSLTSLRLEGNPLCLNFIHQDHYVAVVKLLFPTIVHLDGIRISGIPEPIKNFCQSPDAVPLVEQFLQTFFTLMESKQRHYMNEIYTERAILTVSCQAKIKKDPIYSHITALKSCRDIRLLNEITELSLVGRDEITDYLYWWPPVCHDPYSFTVDVLYHSETTTIITVMGVFKAIDTTKETENDPLLFFTRTFVLSTIDGVEYHVENDMWYISEPTAERRTSAFKEPMPNPLPLSLVFENAPDDDLKIELIDIFSKLTELKRNESARCLEMRNWHLRAALEYFMHLQESGDIDKLCEDDADHIPG